jgi:uncharacterized protein YggE
MSSEWSTKKDDRKIIGYKTTVYVNYDVNIATNKNIEKAIKIQNNLINLKSTNSNNYVITLNSINYTIDEQRKKQYEDMAIEKAIINGKRKANILLKTTYPNRQFQIIGIDINDATSRSDTSRHLYAEYSTPQKNILASGESMVFMTINMKFIII